MAVLFSKQEEKSKEYFAADTNALKFKFQCSSINCYWKAGSQILAKLHKDIFSSCLHVTSADFPITSAPHLTGKTGEE
jgi:hypothetical protein